MERALREVVRAHERRRDSDREDLDRILNQYALGDRCLRKVLLPYLNAGEDVVDAGCGACSKCCPSGEFLPVEERDARIIPFPVELRAWLDEIAQTIDEFPPPGVLTGLGEFLAHEGNRRWRETTLLNAEAMLQKDPGNLGPTALACALAAWGWATFAEARLENLLSLVWEARERPGGGQDLAVQLSKSATLSPALFYWRARFADWATLPEADRLWQDILGQQRISRDRKREAARRLAAAGGPEMMAAAARLSRDADEARSAYDSLFRMTNLPTAVEEMQAIKRQPGSGQELAETAVGFLLAAAASGMASDNLAAGLAALWEGPWDHLPPQVTALTTRELAPTLGDQPLWLGLCEAMLEDESNAHLQFIALEALAALDPLGLFANLDPGSVASVMCRLSPPGILPGWSTGLVEGITAHLSPYQARTYQRLADWVVTERVESMAFAAPATWALWIGQIPRRLPLSADILIWLWTVTQEWEDEAFRIGVLRQVTRQPRTTLLGFLQHLEETLEVLGRQGNKAGEALLDLQQYHCMIPKTRLFNWDELAWIGNELAESAKSCPVRTAALEAWLKYLVKRPNCPNTARHRLQEQLYQLLIATGRDLEAQDLAESFPGLSSRLRRHSPSLPAHRLLVGAQAICSQLAGDFSRFLRELG